MALAVQSQSNTSLGITVAATFGQTPTQDNLLIAVVTASVGTGSISLSNSGWSTGKSIAVGAAGGMVVFYKISAAGGADTTVTANATLAVFMDIQIFEYQLVDDESPLDLTASTADTGSGVTSRASGTTGTLTQAQEIAFVAYAMDGTNGGGAALTNSFNVELTTTHLITGDISVNATTALSSTASWNTSARAAGVILTFFAEVGDSYGLKYQLKPRKPVIDWNNPITKGLVFDAPLFERGGTATQEIISKINGSIVSSGATWDTNIYGPDLDFSTAASSVTFTTQASVNSLKKMSIETLFLLRGDGGGSLARLWSKGNSPSQYFDLIYDSGSGGLVFQINFASNPTLTRHNFSADGLWHHMVCTSSDTTSLNPNTMTQFIGGVLVSADATQNGVGAQNSDTNTFYIGNRSDGIRNWNGKIAYTRIWNRILNAQEIKQLAANPWQIYKQPGLLKKIIL